MKEICSEYKENIKELLKNKWYITITILIAILSYGFVITHYAIGPDDLCLDRYIIGNYIMSAGRWGTKLLYNILGITSFTPFWLDFIVTVLTVIMGILFTAFIKKECKDKLSNIHYIIVTGILISYPMLHNSFLYQSTNLSVILGNLALMCTTILIYENFYKSKKKSIYILITIALPFFISMYESCCQTYMCMTLIIAFLEIYNKPSSKETTKKVIKYVLIAILILAIAIIINSVINKVIYKVLEYQGTLEKDWSTKIDSITETEEDIISMFKLNVIRIFTKMFEGLNYFRTFIILGITSLIITIIKSIKDKKYILIPIILGIIIFNFAINVLILKLLMRVNTSWNISLAFFTVLIFLTANKKMIRNIITVILAFIVFYQTRTMNQLFYNDYKRYQKEANYLYEIANEIIDICEDTTKPLVYSYELHKGIHDSRINEDNGVSLIDWSVGAFGENGTEITKFINALGYNFTIATPEIRNKSKEDCDNNKIEISDETKVYETDEYILVVIDLRI